LNATPAAAAFAAAAPAAAAPAPAGPANVIFIGKIPPTCKREDINTFVSPFGTVKRSALRRIRWYRRVENNLFAYVEFEKAEDAAKAIKELNNKELCGSAVVVEAARHSFPPKRNMFRKNRKPAAAAPAGGAAAPAANAGAAPATEEKKGGRPRRRYYRRRRPRTDAPLSKDVAYVGNLPFVVDEEGMKDIFEGCKFIEARVVRRGTRSKGFGFVTFANEEDRAAAIKIADGSVVEGRKIHVCPARERVERRKTEETPAAAAPATASK